MNFKSWNISQYLLYRLYELGSKHLFGVCGDVVLGFMEQIVKSPVKQINCCNELNAAYAADGYARIHGLGTVVTTFTVGSLSSINAIAGAFAEYVPVVMISGSPERRHAVAGRMLHHTLGADYSIVRQMYQKITVACEYLDDPLTALQQIDTALARCLFYKRPIYFELPADMVVEKCAAPGKFIFIDSVSDSSTLAEALQDASTLLKKAKNPLILLGFELIRHGLQENARDFINKTGYPFCVFVTAKTILEEDHPQFIGCYQGNWSRDYVKEMVDQADCILMLGAFFIDSDTGGFTAHLDKDKLIQANFNHVAIQHHVYENVRLQDFIEQLKQQIPSGKIKANLIPASQALHDTQPYKLEPVTKLQVKRFFKRIASFLRPNDIVVADVGDCLYSVSEILFPKNAIFIAESFYNSIGYSVGAALGAAIESNRRTLLFVGDGSFQMTVQEISTIIQSKCRVVVFILNNQGYGIERAIYDGPYNDLAPWRYYLIPQALGGEPGLAVKTEGELEQALQIAEQSVGLTFIEIQVDKFDLVTS